MFFILLLTSFTSVYSQEKEPLYNFEVVLDSVEIPHKDSLFSSLAVKYQNRAIQEIQQFTYVEKFKWLKYLPSFAWDFSLSRPIFGWNSTRLFEAINYARKNESKITSIIMRLKSEFYSEAVSLSLNYDKFGTKKAVLEQKENIVNLEKTYISIVEDRYKKHEITPSEYLKSKISYSTKILELHSLRYDLLQLRSEILILACYGENIPELNLSNYVQNR